MLNLRYIFRLILAFFSRFKALFFISAIIGVVFFFLLKYFVPLVFQKYTIRIGVTGRYSISNLPISILNKIGNGLTKLDTEGNVEPDLASTWETPDKGKTWIFTLKEGVVWQDGKKVTSQDILYQFSDVVVERPNPKTIIFKLQTSYSAFPYIVSRPVFKSGLLGTGEYKVNKISLNGSVINKLEIQNKNNISYVYKFYPTEEKTKLSFELGQVDQIGDIFNPEPFNSWSRIKLSPSVDTLRYVAVFFNTQDKLLADKSVRQALSYAINKANFMGERAIGPISANSWAYNPQIKPYNFDQAKAKSMINDFKTASKINEITINLMTTPVLLKQAESIQKDWSAVGVIVNLQVITQIPSEYQAFLAISDTNSDPDQYSVWHSTQSTTNITHYQDPRIDKLLEDGRSEINQTIRRKIYLDFQRFLIEDSPAAFLYYPTTYTIARKVITN